MSAIIAWRDFLQTSGKWPPSLTMPPACPPMPRAQVLQAFFVRIAFQSFHSPPTSRALRKVYQTAGQPPPRFTCFIACRTPKVGGRVGGRERQGPTILL